MIEKKFLFAALVGRARLRYTESASCSARCHAAGKARAAMPPCHAYAMQACAAGSSSSRRSMRSAHACFRQNAKPTACPQNPWPAQPCMPCHTTCVFCLTSPPFYNSLSRHCSVFYLPRHVAATCLSCFCLILSLEGKHRGGEG